MRPSLTKGTVLNAEVEIAEEIMGQAVIRVARVRNAEQAAHVPRDGGKAPAKVEEVAGLAVMDAQRDVLEDATAMTAADHVAVKSAARNQ